MYGVSLDGVGVALGVAETGSVVRLRTRFEARLRCELGTCSHAEASEWVGLARLGVGLTFPCVSTALSTRLSTHVES